MIEPSINTVQFEQRYLIAARAFGFTEVARMVMGAMYVDPNPWRIQTLAERLRYSRATIRKLLNDLYGLGLAREVSDHGWVLTDLGMEFYVRLFEQLVNIANGTQRKFSDDFREYAQELLGHHPNAARVNLSVFQI